MSGLEQQTDVDYYKVLGVPRNATIHQICAQYPLSHLATAILHSPAILHCNTKTPMPPTNASPRQLKLSTSSTMVALHSFSRKTQYLRPAWWTAAEVRSTTRWCTLRQISTHHWSWRNLLKILRNQERLRAPAERRRTRRVTSYLQGTICHYERELQGCQPGRACSLLPDWALQRLQQDTHLR